MLFTLFHALCQINIFELFFPSALPGSIPRSLPITLMCSILCIEKYCTRDIWAQELHVHQIREPSQNYQNVEIIGSNIAHVT